MTYSFDRLNYWCTSPVSTLCNGLNLTWAIACRHVSYWEKHQYHFLLYWGFHWDQFWAHYFFQFASMICHFLYKILKLICMQMTLPSGYKWSCVKVHVYNSHYKKILTMQIVGSALTGWSRMPKTNKANVNSNCSKALLCRQDMHEFILVSHLESAYWLCY